MRLAAVLGPFMNHDPDPHGQAALMLCECVLLLLVEEGVLPRERVLDALADVIDVKGEVAGTAEGVAAGLASVGLLRAVAQSLAATGAGP